MRRRRLRVQSTVTVLAGDADGLFDPYNASPGGAFAAGLFPIMGGGQTCVQDGIRTDCDFISWSAVKRCPDDDCQSARQMRVTSRDGNGRVLDSWTRFVQPWEDGWDGSLDGQYKVVNSPHNPVAFDGSPASINSLLSAAARAGFGVSEFSTPSGDIAFRRVSAGQHPEAPSGPVVDASDLGEPPPPSSLLPLRSRYMSQQDRGRFDLAFQEVIRRLGRGSCAALFGGLAGALETLNSTEYRVLSLTSGGPRVDQRTGRVVVTGAQTNSPTSVFINSRGPFFENRMLVPGRGMVTLDFGSRLSGAQFAALLLLHELGHQRGIFGRDADNLDTNLAHTQRVLDACF
jgi:hypothetical protein